MRHHESLLALGRDRNGAERFTTTSMMSAEEALVRDADQLIFGPAETITYIADSAELGLDSERSPTVTRLQAAASLHWQPVRAQHRSLRGRRRP